MRSMLFKEFGFIVKEEEVSSLKEILYSDFCNQPTFIHPYRWALSKVLFSIAQRKHGHKIMQWTYFVYVLHVGLEIVPLFV